MPFSGNRYSFSSIKYAKNMRNMRTYKVVIVVSGEIQGQRQDEQLPVAMRLDKGGSMVLE